MHGAIIVIRKYTLTIGLGMVMARAIRLDDHGEPHRCKHKYQKTGFNETQKCFKCGESIFFDVNYVSISGKCIPLGSYSGKSHVCSKAQIIASS